jgi:hypothetical protein
MQQAYPNQGPPPPGSTQMRPAPVIPNQFGPPPTMSTPQFPQQQQQQQQPPFPNQPPSGIGGAPPYQQAQYPGGQSSYNVPPGSQPPPPTATSGYPQQHLPPHYPNQPNFSGPPTMPGSQLNGPSPYAGQQPSSGPVQQPYQSQRIDPDMVPNVVRISPLSQNKIRLSNSINFLRFKFLNKVKKKLKNHL